MSELLAKRFFSKEGQDPWDAAGVWGRRDARIEGADGRVVFEQKDVEAPQSWGDMAVNIAASKYFRGALRSPERETSIRQLIIRVANTIARWGQEDGYFAGNNVFCDELIVLLLTQRMAFNSPVWFNVGAVENPQVSGCFLLSVEDSMDSIMELARVEAMIFKGGSGTGVNLSNLRGSMEPLAGGGTASGPVSFMRGLDGVCGMVKSGGRTRRAAALRVLNVDHPDIESFIRCKAVEEAKARRLAREGLDPDSSVAFQNANHSVRVTDDFMQAVEESREWPLRGRLSGATPCARSARDVWNEICAAAHACGDPGLQFDDAANRRHTCPKSGRVSTTNACSEVVFLDGSACNLASLNLRRFQCPDGSLDVEAFVAAVETTILAQDILVDRASYPTQKIAEVTKAHRPLGLGYTNLGAFLMVAGLPYDSEAGRLTAAAVTALMTAAAYRQSARIAEAKGAFREWQQNKAAMQKVLWNHVTRAEQDLLGASEISAPIVKAALPIWKDVVRMAGAVDLHGFRNAQVTCLAPAGTISFLMGADTTGVEPCYSLVGRKKLSGGGEMLLENGSVEPALKRLGYGEPDIEMALKYLRRTGTLGESPGERCPGLSLDRLPIFDCAAPDATGRCISWEGHVKMVAAVQPFLSGGCSKTCNLPADATPETVSAVYKMAWKLGLKAISVYRDGCKARQPLQAGAIKEKSEMKVVDVPVPPPAKSSRERMPSERLAVVHKFDVAGHKGYVTAGMYDDGRLGEIFVVMGKEGSTVQGLFDSWAQAASMAIQYKVPWGSLAGKFRRIRFEPSGMSGNPDIGFATSVLDYIVRWLEIHFGEDGHFRPGEMGNYLLRAAGTAAAGDAERAPVPSEALVDRGDGALVPRRLAAGEQTPKTKEHSSPPHYSDSGPPCPLCGSITEPSGACWVCATCGETTGCG